MEHLFLKVMLSPEIAQDFPDGAAGEVVLADDGTVSYIRMTKNGDNYYGPAQTKFRW